MLLMLGTFACVDFFFKFMHYGFVITRGFIVIANTGGTIVKYIGKVVSCTANVQIVLVSKFVFIGGVVDLVYISRRIACPLVLFECLFVVPALILFIVA